MENKSKELTFGDLIQIIFKRKILLLSITLIITILGTLFLEIFYNQNQSYYTTSFTLNYPGVENLTLPDGSSLKYADFISLNSLEKVKNSKEDYKNVDTKNITLNNDISISWQVVSNSANKKDTVYTIKVKAKYFNDKELAKGFLQDLATLPIENIKDMVKSTNHREFLNALKDLELYDEQVNYLDEQKNYLIETYINTITSLQNLSINVSSLTMQKQILENDNSIEVLKSELDSKGYAPRTESAKLSYKSKINALTAKKNSNDKVIEAIRTELENPAYDGKQFDLSKLIELIEENAVITEEINSLNVKLEYASVTDTTKSEELKTFKSNLTSVKDKFENYTLKFENAVFSIYDNLSTTTFETSAIIEETGSISLVISGAISFVLGFIVASATALIVEFVKKKREK